MNEKGATTFAIFVLCITFQFIIFFAAFLWPLKWATSLEALNANEIGIC